jgi:hypothetical protein
LRRQPFLAGGASPPTVIIAIAHRSVLARKSLARAVNLYTTKL